MKKYFTFAVLAILSLKSYADTSCVKLTPNPSCAASEIFSGVWEFVLTQGQTEQKYKFEFTNESVYTCLAYSGYRANLISGPQENISDPAYFYDYDSGKLVVLLTSNMCDFYPSFTGTLTSTAFEGDYVTWGMQVRTEHGKIKGSFIK